MNPSKDIKPEPIDDLTERSEEILKLNIDFDGDESNFDAFIMWMYKGALDLNIVNCIPLLVLAQRFKVLTLLSKVRTYIRSNLQRDTVLKFLSEAVKYGTPAEGILKRCIDVIARNFCHLRAPNFNDIAFEIFSKILSHHKLAIRQEFQLYKIICDYLKAHQDLNSEQVYKLMSNVRFRWLTFTEFEEVSDNPIVPRSLIIEAAMARLMNFECSAPEIEKRISSLPSRLQPRPKFSMVFEYSKDNTELFKGIVGFLATTDVSSDTGLPVFKNPHKAGRVKVHSSSLAKGSRFTLVDISPADVWTNDVPSSWFSIDFGPHRHICLTYYSLRHGGNYKADSLRTWDLQGSMDGIQWKTLKRHNNDKSLNGPYATQSWPVQTTESYRFFRILQTGHNSSNHNFLVLSGFEFYGMLYDNA
jgi:hypothetical protein